MAERRLVVTASDEQALAKCPEGWFDWFMVIGKFQRPQFRLHRLLRLGLLEGKPQLIGWKYRRVGATNDTN